MPQENDNLNFTRYTIVNFLFSTVSVINAFSRDSMDLFFIRINECFIICKINTTFLNYNNKNVIEAEHFQCKFMRLFLGQQ